MRVDVTCRAVGDGRTRGVGAGRVSTRPVAARPRAHAWSRPVPRMPLACPCSGTWSSTGTACHAHTARCVSVDAHAAHAPTTRDGVDGRW